MNLIISIKIGFEKNTSTIIISTIGYVMIMHKDI